ncbi:transposase [Streptomyces sp. NPDC007205]|uniref:transposase n=1 Tax=Streptomyces sp. NPDC007205 TaxID=3154316 RepID=UPI0033FEB9A4
MAALELRHRQRARAEDRIRAARATGLRTLPLQEAMPNQIWLEIIQIAFDLLAWMPLFPLTGQARFWEPRRLRLRLFSTVAQLIATGRRRYLRLAQALAVDRGNHEALDRLHALPNPG